jgi:hypothetical protein
MKKNTELKAEAKFMGNGLVKTYFVFPSDTTKPYEAYGTLKNFDMTKVNDMLGPAAKVKVKSGMMQEMKFNFAYNSFRSVGELELNYEDLKVISLREKKTMSKQSVRSKHYCSIHSSSKKTSMRISRMQKRRARSNFNGILKNLFSIIGGNPS